MGIQLSTLTVEELVARVGSQDPTPGGGSVSALAGALAAALGAMVWELTAAKDSAASPPAAVRETARELQNLGASLIANVTADAAAYEGVVAALRLPKTTDEERAARRVAIQEATRVATEVPLETARLCAATAEKCLAAAASGYQGAVTDAGVGVLMAHAGLVGALYNVEINLSDLDDGRFVEVAKVEAAALAERAAAVFREGDALVKRRLTG